VPFGAQFPFIGLQRSPFCERQKQDFAVTRSGRNSLGHCSSLP
jgi:hypothetical protein